MDELNVYDHLRKLTTRVTRLERLANIDHYGRDLLRCRYWDCKESHPVAPHDDFVTCPTCRNDMGLDRITPSMTSNQAASPVSSTTAATAADADKKDAVTTDPPTNPSTDPSTPVSISITDSLMTVIFNGLHSYLKGVDPSSSIKYCDPPQPMHLPGVGRVGYSSRVWYVDGDEKMKSMVLSLRDEELVKIGVQYMQQTKRAEKEAEDE